MKIVHHSTYGVGGASHVEDRVTLVLRLSIEITAVVVVLVGALLDRCHVQAFVSALEALRSIDLATLGFGEGLQALGDTATGALDLNDLLSSAWHTLYYPTP